MRVTSSPIRQLPAPIQHRWLCQLPQSGRLLVYNSSQASVLPLASSDFADAADCRSESASWGNVVEKFKPRQLEVSGETSAPHLATLVGEATGRCHVVDWRTTRELSATLGRHEFFGLAVVGRSVFLVDIQQEVLVRYEWPTLRNACVMSLTKKSDSTFSTVFEGLQPWQVTPVEDHLIVTISQPISNGAAVCLNPNQRLWTAALKKPTEREWKSSRWHGLSSLLTLGGCMDEREMTKHERKCFSNYWLPGDKYLAYDANSRRLFMSCQSEQSIYAFDVEREDKDFLQSGLQFRFRSAVSLPTALADTQADSDRIRPGNLTIDSTTRKLRVTIGGSHAGFDRLLEFNIDD